MAKNQFNANENGLNLEGLESTQPQAEGTKKLSRSKKSEEKSVDNFSDVDWLTNNEPDEHFVEGETSSKYDTEREPKVQEGLKVIASLGGNFQINPLLILLAKWWEVKSARAAIKKMIDAEAEAKGFAPDVYMQVELAKQIDQLANFQSAIDRVKYAKTYFKPRGGLSTKVPTKQLSILGNTYNVPINELEKAKVEFAGDMEGMRQYLIGVSTLVASVEEL